MLFLLYKDFPIYLLDLPSGFGAQSCGKFVYLNSVKKSDFSMSFFKTYLKIEKMTLAPPLMMSEAFLNLSDRGGGLKLDKFQIIFFLHFKGVILLFHISCSHLCIVGR